MTAACIGTFVMAESGLLEHHHATTTWWLAPLFRRRYPGVELDESSMIVKSGRFVTAGAALSHMDLALYIVRAVSPQLASLTAKYLIVDSRPSQSAYALTDHLVHSDPIVQRFETWARATLTRGFSLDEAAKAVGSSKRTLARRMQSVLGKSPLSYFQSLRVERAVHLLKTGSASVEEVGRAGGIHRRRDAASSSAAPAQRRREGTPENRLRTAGARRPRFRARRLAKNDPPTFLTFLAVRRGGRSESTWAAPWDIRCRAARGSCRTSSSRSSTSSSLPGTSP